ncbi:MAG: hypothetical protein KIT73_12225 [Burkholderiales bacterium]|nr:hypothetical protein [Burkholderiales bacterium]
MLRCVFVLFVILLSGCSTQTSLTADATGCRRGDLELRPSRYKDLGSTTTWCARCKSDMVKCVGNADQTKAICKPATSEDGCR